MAHAVLPRVAVTRWVSATGTSQIIGDELNRLGYEVVFFDDVHSYPDGIDILFSFGPHGRLLPVLSHAANKQCNHRPIIVHWNTEGLPDLRIPWPLMRTISTMRSWAERTSTREGSRVYQLLKSSLASRLALRLSRFRYLGDYYYGYRQGWIDIFADSSAVYGQLHEKRGLPTLFAPWGATERWYADLPIPRDIDVLWMGKRGTKRRSRLIDRVCHDLATHGVKMHIADGEENPFIFDEERTHFLNRAKITLNITRTWYDDNFSRFALAVPNRSLIVSETLLPHCPPFVAGQHYVSSSIDQIVDNILYYLAHEEEREAIVERAYQLVTTQLTFHNSIKTIMDVVEEVRTPANCAPNTLPSPAPTPVRRDTAELRHLTMRHENHTCLTSAPVALTAADAESQRHLASAVTVATSDL